MAYVAHMYNNLDGLHNISLDGNCILRLAAIQPISQVLSTQVINSTSNMSPLDNAIQLTLQYSTVSWILLFVMSIYYLRTKIRNILMILY